MDIYDALKKELLSAQEGGRADEIADALEDICDTAFENKDWPILQHHALELAEACKTVSVEDDKYGYFSEALLYITQAAEKQASGSTGLQAALDITESCTRQADSQPLLEDELTSTGLRIRAARLLRKLERYTEAKTKLEEADKLLTRWGSKKNDDLGSVGIFEQQAEVLREFSYIARDQQDPAEDDYRTKARALEAKAKIISDAAMKNLLDLSEPRRRAVQMLVTTVLLIALGVIALTYLR